MKETGGLLGGLDVKIAQLLVMQRGPGATVSFHTDQVSGEMVLTFLKNWVDFMQNKGCYSAHTSCKIGQNSCQEKGFFVMLVQF